MTNTISEIAQNDLSVAGDQASDVVVKKRARKKVTVVENNLVVPPPAAEVATNIELVTTAPVDTAPEAANSAAMHTEPPSPAPQSRPQQQNPKHHRAQQRPQHQKHSQNKPAAHNSTQPQPNPQANRTSEIDWSAITAVALAHNENLAMFWKVQAIYETDKPYLHLVKKELTDAQLEVFEDDRVTDAVMRGARPPSADEHWRKVYRDDMKALQNALKGCNAWIAETVPEKKHTLHWGQKIARQTNVDKDSQEFYLKKEQKKPKRQEQWRNKSSKGSARFG